MSKLKVELNTAAISALLKSSEVADTCENEAKKIAKRLGDKFKTDRYIGRNRVNASVYTTDLDAIEDNLKHNTILKSMGIDTPRASHTDENTPGTGR